MIHLPDRYIDGAQRLQQAEDDGHLVELWLHNKARSTRDAYIHDIFLFIDYVDLPLDQVRLGDLQDWSDELDRRGYTPGAKSRKLAAVKSLFSFGHKIGYIQWNVGAAISLPKLEDGLAERIIPREEIDRLFLAADTLRNWVLLRLAYASAGRVSELAGLIWERCIERKNGGQIRLIGKGSRDRIVLLPPAPWEALTALKRAETDEGYGRPEDPVFRSREGGHLTRQRIWQIVKEVAQEAGLSDHISPHWFRHAHISHALDGGAPIHLVQQTAGHKSLASTSRYSHARPDDSSANYLE